MRKRSARLAGLLLAISLVPGCLAPKWTGIDKKNVYETPVLNGYAFYYDVSVLLQAPLLLPALMAGGHDKDGVEILETIAMPLAFVGSVVGGTISLPFTLLFFGGKMWTDHH